MNSEFDNTKEAVPPPEPPENAQVPVAEPKPWEIIRVHPHAVCGAD